MLLSYKDSESYLLKLSETEVGEAISRRLQPKVKDLEEAEQKLARDIDPETPFISVFKYNQSHPYAVNLRRATENLLDAWTSHDPHMITRNPWPLAHLLHLGAQISVNTRPAVTRITNNPRIADTPLQGRETLGHFAQRYTRPLNQPIPTP